MTLILQLGSDPVHVMIIRKGIKLSACPGRADHVIKSLYCMRNLEVIMIIMAGIKGLMQLVIGHGMQHSLIYPTGVFPMNHLSHQPEICLYFISQHSHLMHKVKVQHICRIQTKTVNVKLPDPETDDIQKIFLYSRIFLIQLNQKIVTAPVIIGKAIIVFIIAPKVYITVPVLVSRSFPVLLQIPESKEVPACMVKYRIQNHPDSLLMAFCHKGL